MRLGGIGVTALLLGFSLNAHSDDGVLPEGTPVRLRIMRTLSSATASEGNKVDFQTLDDISSGASS
jgi:hypothetical protein